VLPGKEVEMTKRYSLDFAYAQGKRPEASAILRQELEDFRVTENLGKKLTGEGEHVYLKIEKQNLNTLDVVEQISRLAGVRRMDVGYSGLKDRRAITSQWFSVYLPVEKPIEWQLLDSENARLLESTRHQQKLRRGQHQSNEFQICLRNFTGDLDELQKRLQLIADQGVPNYFGPQRFGTNGNNLESADRLFSGNYREKNNKKRGFYLSAARSYLFNAVLSERIREKTWQTVESGDITVEGAVDGSSRNALPTGPLWGRGRLKTSGRILTLETQVTDKLAGWCHGLEHTGLKQERRALVLPINDLNWEINHQPNECILMLRFSLAPGCYATSVIREICETIVVV